MNVDKTLTNIVSPLVFLITFSLVHNSVSNAQQIREWKSYSSFNHVKELDADPEGKIWAVSEGGLLAVEDDQIVQTFTTVDGMYRLGAQQLILDREKNRIFIGYEDGMIDLFDINENEFNRIEDIRRASTFTMRSINKFQIHGDRLYVATSFGIVVYDLESLLVIETYSRLGNLERGARVNDLTIAGNSIWAATSRGVAAGSLDNNLVIQENWDNFNESNGFVDAPVISIGEFQGRIYASTSENNYQFDGLQWSNESPFNLGIITRYTRSHSGRQLIGIDRNEVVILNNEGQRFTRWFGTRQASGVYFDDQVKGRIYVGSVTEGLGISIIGESEIEFITADGPNINFITGIKFEGENFIAGSTQFTDGRNIIDDGKGYFIYENESWRSFNRFNNETLNQFRFRKVFTTAITDQYYYFGSWGKGIARHNRESDEIRIFNNENSTLEGWVSDSPSYTVISGLESDSNGRVWAVSRFGSTPLYQQLPGDDDWVNYNKLQGLPGGDQYLNLYVDSRDLKWITLRSTGNAGRGLLVLDTGDPEDPSDQQGVKLTDAFNDGNLPDAKVTSVIEDLNGEIWVGTERGIARYLFPEFLLTGGPEEKRAQWLINADTTAASPFLLRDINVTDLAVNGANQKWIGTAGEGVWLINAEGNRILEHFTEENSPLLSNSIQSISVKQSTGEVFISTDQGLISFSDVPREGVADMKTLKVFPNPFVYDKHDRVYIDDLSDQTTVRVLGVDGTLIRRLDGRGARISWDGNDFRGQRVGSGVYLVIALDERGDQRGVGKLVIVR